jgi:hypothetical protein
MAEENEAGSTKERKKKEEPRLRSVLRK